MARGQDERDLFATTSRGLEGALEGELRALGARRVRRGPGGVAFAGDKALLMRACLHLRTAHRVLWVLGGFRARDPAALYDGMRRVARWPGLVPPDRTLAVFASARGGVHRDRRGVALKAKDAIVDAVRDACGARPDVAPASPDVRVQLRVVNDEVTVALDAAGESLHARGYRTEAGEAPLRETLAAGLLLLAGWDGDAPLLDPVCGAGTIAVEAALLAARRAPGLARGFGFERWPGHKPERLARLRDEARAAEREVAVPLVGADADAAAVARARDNARRAGVDGLVRFEVADLADAPVPPGGPGLVAANPPYGHRLGGGPDDAIEVYRRLGALLRGPAAGWRAAVLSAEATHAAALGLSSARRFRVANGPLDVDLLVGAPLASAPGAGAP